MTFIAPGILTDKTTLLIDRAVGHEEFSSSRGPGIYILERIGYDDGWPWVEMQATQQAQGLPPEIQMPASSGLEQRCFDVSKKVEAGSGPRPRSIFRRCAT